MFDMKPYIPEPNQCYKCQKYGHIARVCTAQSPRCRLCGETHLSKLCQEKKEKNKDKKLKWANCGKEHHASSMKCQKRKEVARALIVRMPGMVWRVPRGVDKGQGRLCEGNECSSLSCSFSSKACPRKKSGTTFSVAVEKGKPNRRGNKTPTQNQKKRETNKKEKPKETTKTTTQTEPYPNQNPNQRNQNRWPIGDQKVSTRHQPVLHHQTTKEQI